MLISGLKSASAQFFAAVGAALYCTAVEPTGRFRPLNFAVSAWYASLPTQTVASMKVPLDVSRMPVTMMARVPPLSGASLPLRVFSVFPRLPCHTRTRESANG